jgi:hypothetical protein
MLIFLDLDHYAYLHDEKQCQVAIIHLQIISPVTSTENDIFFYGPSLISTIWIKMGTTKCPHLIHSTYTNSTLSLLATLYHTMESALLDSSSGCATSGLGFWSSAKALGDDMVGEDDGEDGADGVASLRTGLSGLWSLRSSLMGLRGLRSSGGGWSCGTVGSAAGGGWSACCSAATLFTRFCIVGSSFAETEMIPGTCTVRLFQYESI